MRNLQGRCIIESIEDMDWERPKIGSWQRLSLVRQRGPSENGAHRHSSLVLLLQLNRTVQADWSDSSSSGSAMVVPGALTLLPAGSRYTKCVMREHDSVAEPAQLLPLMSPAIVKPSPAGPAGPSMFHFSRAFRQSMGPTPINIFLHERSRARNRFLPIRTSRLLKSRASVGLAGRTTSLGFSGNTQVSLSKRIPTVSVGGDPCRSLKCLP